MGRPVGRDLQRGVFTMCRQRCRSFADPASRREREDASSASRVLVVVLTLTISFEARETLGAIAVTSLIKSSSNNTRLSDVFHVINIFGSKFFISGDVC
ncbi:Protein FAM205A [Frankliniella fusca]|uniref:Protein FAM205A n=1 Tax=Frankliniella fusca TaxID=407009 RepID=A0AAE1I077_9NEOP|nr:Protein FAM205A [Frankliniella fusca]KAK3929746.1 Protein FAM205A [Frankliniella fusca]